jgi:hypothetical protein
VLLATAFEFGVGVKADGAHAALLKKRACERGYQPACAAK